MNEIPFEQALAELDAVVRDLEDGRLGLDEALARYERGVALIQTCQSRLQAAEQRILMVTGLTEEGTPAIQPFRHQRTDSRPGI
jgi:exodeoxyribonuclease VII small subunit